MGNDTKPEVEDGYNINQNWGFQINFSIPLSKKSVDQCLAIAKRQEEKMKLDFELVRALKCTEIMQKGFTFRPKSRVAHMCSDVVPIQSLLPKENVSNPKANRFSFLKSEKFKYFIVDIIEKLVAESSNKLDDKVLEVLKKGLELE